MAEGAKATSTTSTRKGYTFDGWYADETLDTVWDFETDVVEADLTLYAKWIENVGINEVETVKISVYPNPTKDIVNINIQGTPEVKIFTMHGEWVRTIYGTSIDLSDLTNGVYILSVDGQKVRVVKN